MIVRRKQSSRFASLPNAIWEDERLSLEAKGMLGYLLSKPPQWNVRLKVIGTKLGVGRERLQRIFRELIAAGYVTRQQVNGRAGFGGIEYVVRDEPDAQTVAFSPQSGNPPTAEPQSGNPESGNPQSGNPTAYKEYQLTKTDSVNPLPQNAWAAPAEAVGLAGKTDEPLGRAGVRLRLLIGDAEFRSWFLTVTIASADERRVVLIATSSSRRSKIVERYGDKLLECWRAEVSTIEAVEVRVAQAEVSA